MTPDDFTITQKFSASFSYAVHFTHELFDPENELLASLLAGANALFVVDANVASHWPMIEKHVARFSAHLPVMIPGGEIAKSDAAQLQRIYEAIAQAGLCRHSCVVAIGGGALLDVAGYAAATAHRGLRLIRVPTTVLAQNDSGMGVKNGINALGKKNFLGTFAPPFAVINDGLFLTTLEDRDWRAGISEAIKVALIKDATLFDFIEQNADALLARDMRAMREIIVRSAKLHLDHISTGGDPFENGSSRPLDFGHWSAHKLEELTNFRLRHGEAVAIGIAIDGTYSQRSGLISERDLQRIIALLEKLKFDLHVPEMNEPDALLAGLEDFRQHLGGELTITLLKSIGAGVEVHQIDDNLMKQCITHVASLASDAITRSTQRG